MSKDKKASGQTYTDFQKQVFERFKQFKATNPDLKTAELVLMTIKAFNGANWQRKLPTAPAALEIRTMIEERLGKKPLVGVQSYWSK